MKQCANIKCNMRDVQQDNNCSKYPEHTIDLCEMFVATDFTGDIGRAKKILTEIILELQDDLNGVKKVSILDVHGRLGNISVLLGG